MYKIKYNFWNSLLSMLIAYVVWIILIYGCFLLSGGNPDPKYLVEIFIPEALFLSVPPVLSLLFVPFIIWSFNKLFKSPKLFILWTSFSAGFLLFSFVACFYFPVLIAGSEKVNLVFILKEILDICLSSNIGVPLSILSGGFTFGMVYLLLGKKFFSKKNPES